MAGLDTKKLPDTLFVIKPEEWRTTGSRVFPEMTYCGNKKGDFLRRLSMSKHRGSIRSKLAKGELSMENIQVRARKSLLGALLFRVSYVQYHPEAHSFYEHTEGFDSRGQWDGLYGMIMYSAGDAQTICVNPGDIHRSRAKKSRSRKIK